MSCSCTNICPKEPSRQEVITPPADLAISLEYAKLQAAIALDDDSLDILLTTYIRAATEKAEAYTGLTFVTTEFRAFWNCFFPALKIQNNPNFTITEIKYIDIDGNEQTLASTEYQVYNDGVFAIITPVTSWPSTKSNTPDAVKIDYTAGYEIISGDITTLTSVSQRATAITAIDHQLTNNKQVEISGANESEYSGLFIVFSVINSTSFTYAITGSPVSPATGAISFKNRLLPADIQLAIAMMVTMMISNRGDCADECGEIPCAAQKLLIKYKPAILRSSVCGNYGEMYL